METRMITLTEARLLNPARVAEFDGCEYCDGPVAVVKVRVAAGVTSLYPLCADCQARQEASEVGRAERMRRTHGPFGPSPRRPTTERSPEQRAADEARYIERMRRAGKVQTLPDGTVFIAETW